MTIQISLSSSLLGCEPHRFLFGFLVSSLELSNLFLAFATIAPKPDAHFLY